MTAPDGAQRRALLSTATRDVLGFAHFDRMRTQMGNPCLVKPWVELTAGAQEAEKQRAEWLLPYLLPLVAAPFVVGARDTLDGRLGNFCLVAAGQFECTRAPHADELHATGDGDRITAVWIGAL